MYRKIELDFRVEIFKLGNKHDMFVVKLLAWECLMITVVTYMLEEINAMEAYSYDVYDADSLNVYIQTVR